VVSDPTVQQEAIGPPPEELLVLVVVRGTNAGSRYVVNPTVTHIGRHPDSDVFLDDVTVSRRHAEVRRTASGFQVVDVGSLNGTYLDGDRIDSGPISEGSRIQVGLFKFVVIGGADA